MRIPCEKCKDRVFKCHSSCERYQEYRLEKQKIGEQIRTESYIYYIANFQRKEVRI